MRTLSSTLLAAQRSSSRQPYLEVKASQRRGGVARLAWERLYTGSEADGYHAATIPGDGSLIRAWVKPSPATLYLQRVTNPAPGSNFSSWTLITTVSGVSGVALTSSGAQVLLFYVGTDDKTVYVRESNDHGATFADPVTILTASDAVGWLAAGVNGSGVVALFYSVAALVYVVKRQGGTWGSPSAWTNSVSAVKGLTCHYQGDWNLALCGQDSTSRNKVWTCLYGDGYSQAPGAWSSLAELTLASPGSSLEFRSPFLARPDVFRLFFLETYTGSYSRPNWSHSLPTADFIDNLWREPVPFDLSCSYGLALAHAGGYAWLCLPSGVWRAALSPASLDLSADVLAARFSLYLTSGEAEVELRNEDGRYSSPGSGDMLALDRGSEVSISPGYRTPSGNETSSGPLFWVEDYQHLSLCGRARLLLRLLDPWGLLEGWKARRQFSWAAGEKNLYQLLSFLHARAGLELSSFSMSPTMTNYYPALTVHPGESGAAAVRRLLDMASDLLLYRGSRGYLKHPLSSEASSYSYGTNHAILEGHYRTRAKTSNRVQVFGQGVFAEAMDWDDIPLLYDRLRQVHDLNVTSLFQAEDRGQTELRAETMAASDGYILVPANCGQELFDVIEVTDATAGLSAAKRRIMGIQLSYTTSPRPRYQQHLILGGV